MLVAALALVQQVARLPLREARPAGALQRLQGAGLAARGVAPRQLLQQYFTQFVLQLKSPAMLSCIAGLL